MKLDSLLPLRKLALLALLFGHPAWAAENCLSLAESAPDHAQALARRLLLADPADESARLCQATAEFQVGAFRAAAGHFAKLAAEQKSAAERARLYNKTGWSYLRANDAAQAGKFFAEALKYAPHEITYWEDHATALMQTEQFWDARRELDYALRLAPNTPSLWALRADCWLKLNSVAKAKSDARQALSLEPEQPLARAVLDKITAAE